MSGESPRSRAACLAARCRVSGRRAVVAIVAFFVVLNVVSLVVTTIWPEPGGEPARPTRPSRKAPPPTPSCCAARATT